MVDGVVVGAVQQIDAVVLLGELPDQQTVLRRQQLRHKSLTCVAYRVHLEIEQSSLEEGRRSVSSSRPDNPYLQNRRRKQQALHVIAVDGDLARVHKVHQRFQRFKRYVLNK